MFAHRKQLMTTPLKLVVTVALLVCAGAAYADPPARAGRLNYVNGTVSLAPGTAPDAWSVAVLNRPLTTGDRLWTDRDGYAEFHVGSTAVRLAPRTNVDVMTLDDDTLQLRLAQGDLNIRVRDVSDDDIEVSTPNGAVLLEQAGSYRISTDPSGDATSVVVHYGRAQVLAPHGSTSVRAGQHVTLRGAEGVPSEIAAARMDAFDSWSAELDRREDQIAATRYVSPHMTGYEDLDAHGTWRTMPEYGAVWVPRVSAGWAPYRQGHWVWIEPWGWTWVDDAPWGFAPFHYGRWVWLNGHWAWAPGPRVVRPVYAPALVAFVGGSNWSLSISSGPAVGWFPLGWREPYFPWYRSSPTYVRNVNITHVQNITVYNNVTRIDYAHQSRAQAVTVVPRDAFVSARPVSRHVLRVTSDEVRRAPALRSVPAQPVESSFAARRANTRPPESAVRREVFATRTPRPRPVLQSATAPESSTIQREAPRTATEPRVRVIERQRANDDGAPRRRVQGSGGTESTPQGTAPQASKPPQAQPRTQAETRPAQPRQRERGPSAPPAAARPQAAQERPPRAEPERRTEREGQQPQRRGEREAQAERAAPPRGEPQNRAPSRNDAAPQRESPPAQKRPQQPEPRSESEPAPRAEPARPQRPEPRSESRPAPRAEPARPQRPEPRPEPRAQRAEPSRPPVQAAPQAQQRAQPARPEARGPQQGPSPRAGGRRENRERGGDRD